MHNEVFLAQSLIRFDIIGANRSSRTDKLLGCFNILDTFLNHLRKLNYVISKPLCSVFKIIMFRAYYLGHYELFRY